jgi:hypothetical protein
MIPLRRSVRLAHACLALACGLTPAGLLSAQQTFAYYHPAAPLYPLFGQELDLNGDGQVECRFYSSGWQGSYYNTSHPALARPTCSLRPQGRVIRGAIWSDGIRAS